MLPPSGPHEGLLRVDQPQSFGVGSVDSDCITDIISSANWIPASRPPTVLVLTSPSAPTTVALKASFCIDKLNTEQQVCKLCPGVDLTAGMVLRGLNYRVRLGAARCQHVFVVIFPELSLGIGYPCRPANSRYLSSRMAFSSTKNITQQNLPLCLTKAEDPRLASKWNVSIACLMLNGQIYII